MRKGLVCYCCCYCSSDTATATAAETTPSSRGWSWNMYIFLTLLQIVVFHFAPGISDTVPPSTKYKEVVSVSGSVGQIPCPVTSFDDVVMILWFKGSSGAPIYSYDARNEQVEPRHMTLKDDWGLRLYFRVWPNNRRYPALMIQELKPRDGGLYRCRVDYRNSPTTNSVTRLKIIEPPTRLEIRDTSPSRPISDQQMMMSENSKHSDPSVTYMGPYSEGQNVTLVCSAYGGKPLPEVRWYRNGDMVDTTYTLSGTEYAINEMTINNLGRNHILDVYSCQASNNNETQALTHKVHLEIYLGVTSVELEVTSPMTAGSEYNIFCKTMGAYPTVKVEFWKNLKRIASRSQMKSIADNMTTTSILYKPEVGDDGTIIICKAENPWVSRKPSVARKTMKIKYAPVTVLRFGRNRTTAFSEGESVLMECHVKANPPAHTIMWFHQGRQLGSNNETVGIRINGMTLFISYLTHQVGGDFNCEAVNDIGKGISNTLPIELHLSPKCVTSEAAQVPLAIGETQWLTCSILAWPSDLNFYWTLNRSDSGGNGEIRRGESNSGSTFRNITEYYHRLPISNVEGEVVVAPGVNNNVTWSSISKSNLKKEGDEETERGKDLVNAVKEKTEQKDSSDQTGYPQLSSGSSSESLDYPEDQHVPQRHPDISSKNAMTTDNMEGTRSGSVLLTASGKEEKRSSQKDILFEKSYSTGGKAISAKENRKSSMDHSVPFTPSDVVLSTSTRDAYSANKFNISSNKLSFPVTAAKLTSAEYVASKVGAESEDEKKTKRHVVYPSSTSSSHFSAGNVDGKSRIGDHGSGHGFQDKIRHKSLISYQVKSEEDYGTVACWATNSLGSQVFPCLFHIIKKDVLEGNNDWKSKKDNNKTKSNSTTDKKQTPVSGNLTATSSSSPGSSAASTTTAIILKNKVEDSTEMENGSPLQRGVSKLQKTLGIVLLLILIFIAGLSTLAFAMLFLLAKRRREIRRIVIAHGPHGGRPRPNSNGSGRSNNKTTNKHRKGAAVSADDDGDAVNKNAPSENSFLGGGGEKDDDGFLAATILPSDMMFAVAVSSTNRNIYSPAMDPFQEIAENKEKPQLSYISTDTTTFGSKPGTTENTNTAAISHDSDGLVGTNKKDDDDNDHATLLVGNNTFSSKETVTMAEEKDICSGGGGSFPQAQTFSCLPSNNNGFGAQNPTFMNSNRKMPLQAQFVDQITAVEEGFKSMTPRAVELFGKPGSRSRPCSISSDGGVNGVTRDEPYWSTLNICNNLNSNKNNNSGGALVLDNMVVGEYNSHLDKDCLMETNNGNNIALPN